MNSNATSKSDYLKAEYENSRIYYTLITAISSLGIGFKAFEYHQPLTPLSIIAILFFFVALLATLLELFFSVRLARFKQTVDNPDKNSCAEHKSKLIKRLEEISIWAIAVALVLTCMRIIC